MHKFEPPSNEKKTKATKIKPNLKKPLKRAKEPEVKPKKAKKVKIEKTKEPDLDLLDLSSLSELSSSDEEEKKLAKKRKVRRKSSTVEIKKEASPEVIETQPPQVTPPPVRLSEIRKDNDVPPASPSPISSITTPPVTEEAIIPITVSTLTRSEPMSPAYIPPTPTKQTTTNNPLLTPQEEWLLLQKLEHSSKKLSFAANRYKRKLAVRRLKRNLGIKPFDIDNQIVHLLKLPKHTLEPISKDTTIQPASNQQIEQVSDDQQHMLEKITFTPYASSFASRLYGSIRQRHTMTRDEPWLSSWNGRKLRPFIRRDFQSKPRRMLLMGQIKACQGKPVAKGTSQPDGTLPGESIDYVYFQREHLSQVNLLLSRSFWEGIDVSESLLFPEFSIVALYKRHVIGCAFMTPEAYITYFAVDPGWTGAGIGQ